MSKAEFIASIARKGGMSSAEARRAVDLVFSEIEAGVKRVRKGGKFVIPTLGAFSVKKRAARTGRDPRTGEAIEIKAGRTLRFRPSANLKAAAGS